MRIIYTKFNNMQIQEFFWIFATKAKLFAKGWNIESLIKKKKKKKNFFRNDLNEQKHVFVIIQRLITTKQCDLPVTQTLRTNHVADILVLRRDEIYFATTTEKRNLRKANL